MDKGKIFKAAMFAASQLNRVTAEQFADAQAGKLHGRDGSEIDRETLIAGYNRAAEMRKEGQLTRVKR